MPGGADEQGGTAPELSLWCVAFLDLLGYQKVLQEMDVFPFPESAPGFEKVDKAFARAVWFRRRLEKHFLVHSEQTRPFPTEELSALSEHQRAIVETWTGIKLIQTTGADHVAIGCSLADDKGHSPIMGVYTILSASASGMLTQLMLGGDDVLGTLPLRGGIDIAIGGLDQTGCHLYSAALANAYALERKAVHPRILVSPRLREYLLSVSTNIDGDPFSQFARRIALRATDLITTDADNMAVVDFFGAACVEYVEHPRETGEAAWRFANASLERFERAGDLHVAEKYKWLVDYMRPRLHHWGIKS
jgi:hypothetical protein